MLLKPGRTFVASLVAFALLPTVRAADNLRTLTPTEVMPGVRDYGFLWWAEGWRGRSEIGGKCSASGRGVTGSQSTSSGCNSFTPTGPSLKTTPRS
jgi:hypothetical protein